MSSERGVSFIELMVILALGVVLLMMAAPNLRNIHAKHQQNGAARKVQSLVSYVRLKALKEKLPYRLVLHDENALTPNRVEVQWSQGGSYATEPGGIYELPDRVRILGGGGTDSVDQLTVSKRGACSTGNVYVQGTHPSLEVVVVESTCLTKLL